jgi:catechol 2,3-dioxygenase
MPIDSHTTIGTVHLTIPDLERSLAFYTRHLGFCVLRQDAQTAMMGSDDHTLLVLTESRTAKRVRGTAGLYHFAVLVPSRLELARSLDRLLKTDTVLQGAADHGVSEAIYLADPDGNGIEIYRDRPRSDWPWIDGRLRMGSDPLDLDGLLSEVRSERPSHDQRGDGAVSSADGKGSAAPHDIAPATTIGHVHLHVSNLTDAARFYGDVLGLELMQRYGGSALFFSAGGYHHHIGVNTWAGVGAPPAPAGAIGLRFFELRFGSSAAREEASSRLDAAAVPIERGIDGPLVRDPSHNAILLVASES